MRQKLQGVSSGGREGARAGADGGDVQDKEEGELSSDGGTPNGQQ